MGTLKRISFKILTILLILIIIPIGLVLGGPIICAREAMMLSQGRHRYLTLILTALAFFLGFILDPFIILIFVVGLVPGIIFLIYFIVSERNRNWNNAHNTFMMRN